ncbi:hypothetical protein CCACVL1_28490 [Corchorus capsularis]|uniref:Uncharacterized protein n=1 Tax=Corchorus capsularis TaxID=210143 RepID=A0A1R3G6B4_COCAP|nr:hypothetical protein CCACVL1_28490 [Corchorus capsularis]
MMEGIKGGGRIGVGEVIDDMGDGMQCSDHPYRNNPGGICAFCLQEKLGKLVSSSFPLPIRGSSSSSSSPSFRSDTGAAAIAASCGGGSNGGGVVGTSSSSASSLSLSLSVRPTGTKSRNDNGGNNNNHNNNSHYHHEYYTRRARIPFLLAKKKKKIMVASSDHPHHHHHHGASAAAADIVFKRSKSTTTPRRARFMDDGDDFSPRKRSGFWSFLYLSSKSHHGPKKLDKVASIATPSAAATAAAVTSSSSVVRPKEKCLGSSLSRKGGIVIVEEDDDDNSPNNSQATPSAASSSFERKVSRSRSVGCGSRSFSGDFFERISTGFGDCTLRRVESQREGKPKVGASSSAMKERVKCGGIFGGFIMTSSSSSSSSSSYWVSSSAADDVNGKPSAGAGALVHGRSKSWGWAFASPMRAFSKPSSKDGKRDATIIRESNSKNTTPNLSAIPSLLAVRG